MQISAAVAQFPIGWDIEANLAAITAALARTQPGDLVVLPEAAVSGYGPDLADRLVSLDPARIEQAIDLLGALARRHEIDVCCGSLRYEQGGWWNAAVFLGAGGERWTYRKINLARIERGVLRAGASLPPRTVRRGDAEVTLGVQLCREIRYPEQWQQLARSGAQVFGYLTNAANADAPAGVWRSHLISRAAENQRYLLAANLADPDQHCPTMIVSPHGEVLAELAPGETGVLRVSLDLTAVSNWNLDQQRRDVVDLRYTG
ncbi:hydrolase [Actinocatenispora thailandica]|uniref:Hydrolase n=1 Tax=Actinocatenispora thailandica TaxID=227318 RepID=A0A7R7HW65_9ACTN|nr:carbon-nitrogen hydrolase family protein [Actinocatenispora thailandica]BCJ33818.1 hydrolase [Actinocatenispora thailandica]